VDHLIVTLGLEALLGAIARTPPSLRGDAAAGLARDDGALEAFLEDVLRDRLFHPGPHPSLGTEVRVPPPPRDVPFRRHVLLAASAIADPEVAPAVRLALAVGGARSMHPFRRLAQVAEALLPLVDPAAPLADPVRAEELARRIASAFHLSIAAESTETAAARLAAVDARAAAQGAREADERRREAAIAVAIEAAAKRPAPLRLVPD
jgi:hypothetical protein